MKRSPSIVALAVANLVPLSGVLLMGWDAAIIILLYWTENLVIGFYNILKLALVKVAPPFSYKTKLVIIPFFCLHFGGFCGIHGLFLMAFFRIGNGMGSLFPSDPWFGPFVFIQLLFSVITTLWQHLPKGMIWPFLCLFASHGISFVQNYLGQKEYLSLNLKKLMNLPYKRIFIMHVTIIAGGWMLMLFHSPMLLVCLFVLFKIGLDIYLHNKEHRATVDNQLTTNHE